MSLPALLKTMVEKKGSDLFFSVGVPPKLKVDGKLQDVGDSPLTDEDVKNLLWEMTDDKQKQEFLDTQECNFAISHDNVGRFRVNAYQQQGHYGMVLRRIETVIPQVEDLDLPPIIKELALTKRGLIIFVGATGSGKSSSLAAMIGYRNQNSSGHIITIEDPVEFVHQHAGCIVTQREVGVDTASFDAALKNTLRQAPDVILIGEIRSHETMEHAVAFAETGHLCLATLHANNANQALDRIINFFPEERHNQVYMDLSLNLKAMIAQQLIPKKSGKGRRVAIEVLINTPLVSDLVRKGEVHEIKPLMKKSRDLGMQTFDQALFDLYQNDTISYEDALRHADSPNDLRLMIKLANDQSSDNDDPLANVSVLE